MDRIHNDTHRNATNMYLLEIILYNSCVYTCIYKNVNVTLE